MAFPLSKKQLRYAIAGFAVLGAAFMGYLTHLHSSGSTSAVCDLSKSLSCSFVNSSTYSELFGIPVAVLGILYFLTLIVMMLVPLWPDPFRDAVLFTVFSLLFGLYLSSVELLVLESFCLFCELSKLIMAVILMLAVQGCKAEGERVRWSWVGAAVGVALAFSGAAYLLQREPPMADPDVDPVAVAECLSGKNVVMYGTYWCPNCKRQRKWFGDAFSDITEVECDPRGKDARPEECVARLIEKTPTWIQEDDGVEVRRYTGAAPVAEIADYFDCR